MTTATGPVGTSGLTISMLLWNRAGQVWNGSAFVSFVAASWALYVIATTELGTITGLYRGAVPAGAQATWARATFHQGATQSAALAYDENPTITDAAFGWDVPDTIGSPPNVVARLRRFVNRWFFPRAKTRGAKVETQFAEDGVTPLHSLQTETTTTIDGDTLDTVTILVP